MQYIRFYIIFGLTFLTFCVGLFNYKYLKDDPFLKYFFYFISYTFLGELISLILIENELSGSTVIYNLYSIVSPVFLTNFFRHYMKSQVYRKISIGLLVMYLLAYVLNSIYYQNFVTTIQNNSWILEYFTVALVIVFYLFDILKSDRVLKLKKLPDFWIAIGYFFSAVCFIPVLVIARFIEWSGIFNYLLLIGNIILYGCIIKAFLVSKKEFNT